MIALICIIVFFAFPWIFKNHMGRLQSNYYRNTDPHAFFNSERDIHNITWKNYKAACTEVASPTLFTWFLLILTPFIFINFLIRYNHAYHYAVAHDCGCTERTVYYCINTNKLIFDGCATKANKCTIEEVFNRIRCRYRWTFNGVFSIEDGEAYVAKLRQMINYSKLSKYPSV